MKDRRLPWHGKDTVAYDPVSSKGGRRLKSKRSEH